MYEDEQESHYEKRNSPNLGTRHEMLSEYDFRRNINEPSRRCYVRKTVVFGLSSFFVIALGAVIGATVYFTSQPGNKENSTIEDGSAALNSGSSTKHASEVSTKFTTTPSITIPLLTENGKTTALRQGIWGDWGAWSDCSLTCGEGNRSRSRICVKISDTDLPCEGASTESEVCNLTSCPDSWGDWGDWSSCSVTCEDGSQTRTRACSIQDDEDPPCIGDDTESKACNSGTCGTKWGDWGSWTSCTVTCGGGTYKRYRQCNKQSDTDLPCLGTSIEISICNNEECPVPATWTTWETWGSCDVSCGGGIQTRTRFCQSEGTEVCVGSSTMTQICNSFACPDCKKECPPGSSLNTDTCDICICDMDVLITVKAANNAPVFGATIYYADAPTREITQTNQTGKAIVNGACTNAKMLISRTGFQDTSAEVSSSSVEITLLSIEYPHFTTVPKPKVRLVGENVTLCCSASANPAITFYEWFRNGILLDTSLYPNGTTVTIGPLRLEDSGDYRCRANSPAGSAKSDVATLQVQGSSTSFCSDALEEKKVDLPSDCIQPGTNTSSFEVGYCNPQKCRQSGAIDSVACREDSPSCCSPSVTENVNVQCRGYALIMLVIKACSCSNCTEQSVSLSGVATAKDDGAPLRYGDVWVNGVLETYTSYYGRFTLSLSPDINTHVITLKDTLYGDFLDMTKIISVIEGVSSMEVTVKLLRAAEPVQILSTEENTLAVSSDTRNSYSIASISVPSNAFVRADGTQHNGTVIARVTVIDPTDMESASLAPGTFTVVDEEGEDVDLQSAAVISLQFQDENNTDLHVSEMMSVSLNSDVFEPVSGNQSLKLYGLDSNTGKWTEMSSSRSDAKRKKRSKGYLLGEIDVNDFTWLNIDRVLKSYACYFKAKIFQNPFNGQSLSEAAFLNENIMMNYIAINAQRTEADIRTEYSSSYLGHCLKIICQEREGLLHLFVNMNGKYESVIPLDPQLYSLPAFTDYTVSGNGKILNVTLTKTKHGPFFSSLAECQKEDNAFYFSLLSTDANVFTLMLNYERMRQIIPPVMRNYVWYQWDEDEKSAVCVVKVQVTGEARNGVGIRALSIYNADNSATVMGIREMTPDSSGIVCIEYRCSEASAQTTLTLIPVVKSSQSCTVQSDGTNLVGNDIGDTFFETNMPEDSQNQNTIFSADLYRFNLIPLLKAINHAQEKCTSDQNGQNIGITFNCEWKTCSSWWKLRNCQ